MSYITAKKLVHRIYVGTTGNYKTLKEATDWFNASATSDCEILLDAGNHNISDTITVNNASYNLAIRGLGSNNTNLNAATGLTGKPMFDIKTSCDITRINADGSTLASYGTVSGENFCNYSADGGVYSEVTDFTINNFYYGFYDTAGIHFFLFNFIISNCVKGTAINHTGTGSVDIEVGNYTDCTTGIDFISATADNVTLDVVQFIVPSGGTAIKYDGANYGYGDLAKISGCTWNNVGTFADGFDFTRSDSRDANIVVIGNVGIENKNPHCKVNVVDNTTTTTTVTTAGTYYKTLGIHSKTRIIFDAAATAGTFTFTVDDQTTAAIAYNADAATIKAAIELLSNVTTVTVTQIVASKEWTVEFMTASEGWVNQSVNISGLSTTTAVTVSKSFYNCKTTLNQGKMTYQPSNIRDGVMWISGNLSANNNNRNVTIGIKKNNTGEIIAPFTVRTATSGQPYGFSLSAYLEDMAQGDYYELFLTSSTNGDVITLQDLTWYFDSR